MDYDIYQWPRWKKWTVLFTIYVFIGLWQSGIFISDNIASFRSPQIFVMFVQEMTAAMTAFILLPFILYFFKKVPLRQGKILVVLPWYFLVWIIYGTLLTFMLFYSRSIMFYLFDLGRFEYGLVVPRIMMETTKQFFIFWTIYFIRQFVIAQHETNLERIRAEKYQKELTRSRLQTLQMQLNPHFLFNTLNVISSTMYENIKAADSMIADLSDLLRKSLNALNWEQHTVHDELDILDLYLKIMKQRFQEKLSITLDVDENTLQSIMPGFLLQPLVENAIHYSMEEKENAEVRIIIQRTDESLLITISDKGPGLQHMNSAGSKSGIGIANCRERLAALYGERHSLEFLNNNDGGLNVKIQIPLQSNEG